MQGVAELVEQSLYIIHRQQRRIAGCRFVEVAYVDNHRAMIHALGIHVLRHDIVHPSTRTFAGTREIVGVEDTDQFAVCTGHLEYFYLGVIHRHILQRLELQAIQFGSHAERAFAYIAQFEVRLDLFLVQCIFGLAQFLGIVPPIPGLQFLARQISVQ